ncbi:hypothetical protein U1Q18_021346 [Sarracenia purpurea var. burkii]
MLLKTNDYSATPQELKDQVSERYPGARRAYLKTGGDFPFLSRPDEINLHLQLHLRRVGLEARPDLVRGISENASGGGSGSGGGGGGGGGGESSSEQNNENENENRGDAPKDDTGSSGTTPPETEPPPAPDSPDSHHSNGQLLLCNAKVGAVSDGNLTLLLHAIFKRQQYLIATNTFLYFYVGVFYSLSAHSSCHNFVH